MGRWLSGMLAACLAVFVLAPSQAQSQAELREAAFRAAQNTVHAAVTDSISLASLRSSAPPALAALVEKRWALMQQIEEIRAERSESLAQPATADRMSRRANLFDLESRLLKELEALDTRITDSDARFAALYRPQSLEVAEVQKLLRPDEALVLISPGVRATYIFAITGDGATWRRSAATEAALALDVEAVRASLGAAKDVRGRSLRVEGARPSGFDRTAAHRIYRDVLEPVADAVAGRKVVYIVRSGVLRTLPMGLLVTAAPKGADGDPAALRDTSFLIDRHAIAELPTVATLKLIRTAAAGPRRAGGDFVGIGAPRFAASASRAGGARGLADTAVLGTLPELAGAARELQRVQASLPAGARSLLLTGADASEDNVRRVRRSDVETARLLVFATHALQASEPGSAGEPGLVMATPAAGATAANDGFLSASEISALRLQADLVVLSACNTAGDRDEMRQDGVGALSQSFFAAGARALMVSHWPVDDRATALLMEEVLQGGAASPAAFQAAVAKLRRQGDMLDPKFWGAFTFVGVAR